MLISLYFFSFTALPTFAGLNFRSENKSRTHLSTLFRHSSSLFLKRASQKPVWSVVTSLNWAEELGNWTLKDQGLCSNLNPCFSPLEVMFFNFFCFFFFFGFRILLVYSPCLSHRSSFCHNLFYKKSSFSFHSTNLRLPWKRELLHWRLALRCI